MTPSADRRALVGYAALSVVYLAFVLAGLTVAEDITKPLLMPTLALAVGARAPRLLLGAIAASCLGDIFLVFGGNWFLLGMGGFAVAHLCYIRYFVRAGALRDRTRLLRTAVPYGLAWAVLITSLWPDLASGLRIPLAVYSLLLASTAVTSACAGRRTGLGGGLFLVSDTLIATGLAHWPQLPVPGFWVMSTYLTGQYLLTTGRPAAHREPGGENDRQHTRPAAVGQLLP